MSSISSLSENFRHLLGFGPSTSTPVISRNITHNLGNNLAQTFRFSTSEAPMPKCLSEAMKAVFAEASDE